MPRDGAAGEMSGVRGAPITGAGSDPELAEGTLALQFVAEHGERIRYTPETGRWFRWTGRHWQPDRTTAVFDLVRQLCRRAARACESDGQARSVFSAKTIAAVERIARMDGTISAPVERWDHNEWLLNTPTGAVELQGGKVEIAPHAPAFHCTKIARAGPDSSGCKRWRKFLDRVTGGDIELSRYLQRVAGYCLTGSTREHALFFIYGTGANGKSVFLNTLTALLGDYARVAPMTTFTDNATDRHETELAMLQGARLVVASETDQGKRWAESRIKSLTGGDPITARFMRQDHFTFVPQFKLMIAGNHKPGLRSIDEAIRRRFHLIPFTVTIPAGERDSNLQEKLRGEWGGILQWAIEGCIEWQRIGLAPPDAVTRATDEYFSDEDALATWLAECCRVGSQYEDTVDSLFRSWTAWATRAGEHVGAAKAFSQAMQAKGFESARTKSARRLRGVMVPVQEDPRYGA